MACEAWCAWSATPPTRRTSRATARSGTTRGGASCCAGAAPGSPSWPSNAASRRCRSPIAIPPSALTNTRLYLERDRLPPPEAEEFYLADLVGLAAFDSDGAKLGAVTTVHDYGAGASLEIAREGAPALLVPFTRAAVPEVDLPAGRLAVVLPVETVPSARSEATAG